jgi:DNA-binding NtrC family response regulator
VVEHLGGPLRLADVARAARLSPFHFHRVFQVSVGETLAEFVKRLRLERAFSRSTGCSSARMTPDAQEMLFDYEWPRNVRELHNALERAAILCEGGPITNEHLSLRAPGFAAPRLRANLPDVERRTIEQALHETAWNKSKAARRLGITRTQLYGRLRKYGLETVRTP